MTRVPSLLEQEVSLSRRGAAEGNAGRTEAAIEPLEGAMRLNQQLGRAGVRSLVSTASIALMLGLAYQRIGRNEDAFGLLAMASDYYENPEDEEDMELRMNALAGLGHCQLEMADGDPERLQAAASCFLGELELAEELADVEAAGEALYYAGKCLADADDRDDWVVELLEVGVLFLVDHPEIEEWDHQLVRQRNRLGNRFRQRGEPARSLSPFREAAEGARGSVGCSCRLYALEGLIDGLESVKEGQAAAHFLKEAIEVAEGEDDHRAIFFRARLGRVIAGLGDRAEGVRRVDRAIEQASELVAADPGEEICLEVVLAVKASLLNDSSWRLGQALDCIERSLEIARRLGRTTVVNRLLIVAAICVNSGEPQNLRRAIGACEEARDLALEEDELPDAAAAHRRLAVIYTRRGQLEAANFHYERATEIATAAGDHCERASILIEHAGLPGLSAERIMRHLSEARNVAGRAGSIEGEAVALRELAKVNRAAGLLDEAAVCHRRGTEIVESVRARLDGSLARAELLEVHQGLYADAAILAWQRNEPRLAFRYAEAGRARMLLDKRAADAAGYGSDPESRGRRAEIAAEIARLARELEALGGRLLDPGSSDAARGDSEAEAAVIEAELERLEAGWRRAEELFVAEDPRLAVRARAGIDAVWTVAKVQEQLLDRDSVLLEFVVAEEDCLLFCVTADAFEVFPLGLGAEPLRHLVEELCVAVDRRDPAYPNGHRLYLTLLAPAAHLIDGKKKVLISPDGPLHHLPFALLLEEDPGVGPFGPGFADRWSELPYFLDGSREIRYVASATSEGMLAEIEGAEPAYREELVAVSATLEDGGSAESGLAELRHAEKELGGLVVKAVEHVDRRQAVELLRGGSFRFVHVLSHALPNDRTPWRSSLVFEPEEGDSSPSHLYAAEAIDLQLRAQCVTLSGCQTLGATVSAGEGVLGLGHAFKLAGAREVCASRWPVSDRATALLMADFYAILTSGGRPSAAAALASSQRILIDQSFHPFYWAAFGVFS